MKNHLEFILDPAQSDPWPLSLVGGKAAGLQRLRSYNYTVPDFFVLSTDLWSYWRQQKQLPANFLTAIQAHVAEKKWTTFSVRSSSLSEDSQHKSNAGLFYTGLNVTAEKVEQEILKVFESGRAEPMAVVLQKMLK